MSQDRALSVKQAETRLARLKAKAYLALLTRKLISLDYQPGLTIEIEVFVDGEGEVVKVNPMFRMLLGKSFDAFMGYLRAKYSNVREVS